MAFAALDVDELPALPGVRAERDDRRAGRRRDHVVRGRHRAEADTRHLQLEHRCAVALGVEGKVEWDAVHGVPCEPHRAEQAAVLPGGDPYRIGGGAAEVSRDRTVDRQVCHELPEVRLDLSDGRDRVRAVRAGSPGAGTAHPKPAAVVCRKRALVDGVGSRVVYPERAVVDDDLGVAVVGLELNPEVTSAGPQASARAGDQRIARLDQARVDQIVGEADPGADAVRRSRPERLMDRGGERGGRGHRTVAGGGDRDRRAACRPRSRPRRSMPEGGESRLCEEMSCAIHLPGRSIIRRARYRSVALTQ